MPTNLGPLVTARLGHWGVDVDSAVVDRVSAYLDLVARWNTRINLTAFDLTQPSAHAIDRLIVEPLAAARMVRPSELVAIDIGSGGGSPALPMKIALPALEFVLVESRERKSAFLREAVRVLGLSGVVVETTRLTGAGLPRWNTRVDVGTMRAVRGDGEMWEAIGSLLKPGGRLLWFVEGSREATDDASPVGWRTERHALVGQAILRVLTKPA